MFFLKHICNIFCFISEKNQFSYLNKKEANRILVNGGKILFHHSNADFSPELQYVKKPHSRNFMSADIFAYLAMRNGFMVLSQDVFSWGGGENLYPDIDCLSLCRKIKDI
jgi:hypothetical protein